MPNQILNSGFLHLVRLQGESSFVEYKTDADVWVGDEPNPAYPFMGPVDISRAMEELNYKPMPFSKCVYDYVEQTKTRGAS